MTTVLTPPTGMRLVHLTLQLKAFEVATMGPLSGRSLTAMPSRVTGRGTTARRAPTERTRRTTQFSLLQLDERRFRGGGTASEQPHGDDVACCCRYGEIDGVIISAYCRRGEDSFREGEDTYSRCGC